MKRTALPPGKPMRRQGRKAMPAAEKAALDVFNELVLNDWEGTPQPCLWSITRSNKHHCEGPLDAHYLIEKQFLRNHPPFTELPEDEHLAIVYDPRIGVPLCRFGAHAPVTNHLDYVYLEEIPLAATDFAVDLNIVHRLERECPRRPA